MTNKILIFLLVLCSFILSAQGSFNPDDYDNRCMGIPGMGDYTSIDVYFNDPDYDCVSNDWIADYYTPDGRRTRITSWNGNNPDCNGSADDPDCWSEVDFGDFYCCEPVAGNGAAGGSGSGTGGNRGSSCISNGCGTCMSPDQFKDCVISCNYCRGL